MYRKTTTRIKRVKEIMRTREDEEKTRELHVDKKVEYWKTRRNISGLKSRQSSIRQEQLPR